METALELAPDDSWTRVLLGLIYLEIDELEQSAEQLMRAADERTDDAEAQVVAALAAAAVGWEAAALSTIARVDFSGEDVDEELTEEARDRIEDGKAEALRFLTETVAPLTLRERLTQPL
jgi:predicted Zn-dependent protease